MLLFLITASMISGYSKRRIKLENVQVSEHDVIKLDLGAAIVIFFISIVLVLLVTYRSELTGTDTKQYMYIWQFGSQYAKTRANSSGEWFFWIIYSFCIRYADIRVAFFVYALISIWFALIAIYKLSIKANPFFVTFVYLLLFYQECFNLLRQMSAMAFVFLAFAYVFDRKLIRYVVCIVAAIMFHTSAVFALPIYWIYRRKKLKISSVMGGIVGISVVLVGFQSIATYIVNVLGFTRFAQYMDIMGERVSTSGLGWLYSFLIMIPLYLILYYANNQSSSNEALQNDPYEIQFLWMLSAVVGVSLLLRLYVNWVFRVGYYYQIGMILLGGMYSRKIFDGAKIRKYTISSLGALISAYYIVYYIYLNYFNNFATSALVNFHLN